MKAVRHLAPRLSPKVAHSQPSTFVVPLGCEPNDAGVHGAASPAPFAQLIDQRSRLPALSRDAVSAGSAIGLRARAPVQTSFDAVARRLAHEPRCQSLLRPGPVDLTEPPRPQASPVNWVLTTAVRGRSPRDTDLSEKVPTTSSEFKQQLTGAPTGRDSLRTDIPVNRTGNSAEHPRKCRLRQSGAARFPRWGGKVTTC